MKLIEGKTQPEENKECKSGSINETVWKITVKTPYSYYIGDTTMYCKYTQGQGIAKQLRMSKTLKFKTFEQALIKEPKFDEMLQQYDPMEDQHNSDFEKKGHTELSHTLFRALDAFKEKNNGELPAPWSVKDALKLITEA